MDELRRITLSSLLMLLLQVSGTRSLSSYIVRDGNEATLSCENVNRSFINCASTTWVFNDGKKESVELVTLGSVKSDRLSLSPNCSLVINKVTAADAGRYYCQQFISGIKQGEDARVDLKLFSLPSPPSTGGEIKATTESSTNPGISETNLKDRWWLFVIVVVIFMALLIIVIMEVIRRKRRKRNKTLSNDNTVHEMNADGNVNRNKGLTSTPASTHSTPENNQDMGDPAAGVFYASIIYKTNTNNKSRDQSKNNETGGNEVTYSTLKDPFTECSDVYATVDLPSNVTSAYG